MDIVKLMLGLAGASFVAALLGVVIAMTTTSAINEPLENLPPIAILSD